MNVTHYIRSDVKRLLKTCEIYIGIMGVTASLFFSLEDYAFVDGMINNSALATYLDAADGSGVMIAYAFSAFPFATVFCADLEYRYIRYSVIRGSLKKYVCSKILMIFITAAVTMIMGNILFLVLVHTQIPWVDMKVDDMELFIAGSYGTLIKNGHYFLYGILFSVQLGLLAGLFSVFAAFVSLYISNKVTILVMPILLLQVLYECAGTGWFNVFIFYAYNKPFSSDIQYFITVLAISLMPTVLLAFVIYKRLQKSM